MPRPTPFFLLPLLMLLAVPLHTASAQDSLPDDPTPPAGVPADAPDPLAASASATPAERTQSVVINLINRMVERGLLTKEEAEGLIRQAEEDADAARQQAAMAQAAVEQTSSVLAMLGERETSGPNLDPFFTDKQEGAVRVTYIPEHIRTQMRDEIRQDVMDQATAEGWVTVGGMPSWAQKVRLFGDVRVRYESISYPDGNDNTGSFPDFNAINTGAPFDVAGTVFSPQWNTDRHRDRTRLRVRVGAEVMLHDGFSAGVRIATGSDNSPVTTNQTLGGASGQGGNFSKYAIWLDRGFLRYETEVDDLTASLTLGRFDNPFFSSEVMWDDDLGFDGLALEAKYKIDDLTPFFAGGAFPVFNTSLNYATNQPSKFGSYDKWLYGAQLGFKWKATKDIELKLAAAYYDFQNIEGRLSDPFVPLTASDAGSTDASRPAFAQKGNTYRALRNITPNALNNYGTLYQYQYFGLASPFRLLALTGRLDYNRFEPVQISLSGEFVKNLAFNKGAIESYGLNNRIISSKGIGRFEGGDTAWIVGLSVGHAVLEKRWDWRVGMNYRYVESDAVVDGFTDSDFALGGTNVKGAMLFGNLALSPDVFLGARWMSSDQIAGPPFKMDILQLDISAKF